VRPIALASLRQYSLVFAQQTENTYNNSPADVERSAAEGVFMRLTRYPLQFDIIVYKYIGLTQIRHWPANRHLHILQVKLSSMESMVLVLVPFKLSELGNEYDRRIHRV
jgi:hypothetical protein